MNATAAVASFNTEGFCRALASQPGYCRLDLQRRMGEVIAHEATDVHLLAGTVPKARVYTRFASLVGVKAALRRDEVDRFLDFFSR